MTRLFSQKLFNFRRLPFFLFIFISTIYFCSSVGLMNSMDTTQYFTGEALIRNGNLYLDAFQQDPHYFVWPDIYFQDGHTISPRGYLLNVITLPLHYISAVTKDLYRVDNFDPQVVVANFTYELSIVSLYVFFSSIGMMLFWQLSSEFTQSKSVATIMTVLLAFGSYIWKYSASYMRQGFIFFLMTAATFCIWRWFKDRQKPIWLGFFLLCWAISFGIDLFLFLSLTVYMALYILWSVSKTIRRKQSFNFFKKYTLGIILTGFFIALNILVNFYWYNNLFFSQQYKFPLWQNEGITFWDTMSTPFFPTVFVLLFNFGNIPPESLENFNSLPLSMKRVSGLEFVQRYNFFGMFTISSFLLVSLFCLLRFNKAQIYTLIFAALVFLQGLFLYTKILSFWGGTQYDIRYLYPYIVMPGLAASLGLKNAWDRFYRSRYRIYFIILFFFVAFFSLLMGWLGVISMFKPALTGERRIWIDIYSLPTISSYSWQELVNATFMNRQNAWIGASVGLVLSGIYLGVQKLIQSLQCKSKFTA